MATFSSRHPGRYRHINPMTGYFKPPAPALRFYWNTGTPQTALDAGGCESGVRSPRLAGAPLFPNTERAPALAGARLKKLPACSPPKRHKKVIINILIPSCYLQV
ncbi:MAG: hypothetical protein KME26_29880 [Oscillatoria princeps RMCB-10]|nr:hypothetical protein [Oscillatoria princeps RMCB-10]